MSSLISSAQLSWPNGQPFSEQFSDPYFSADNGLDEGQHVFLQHNAIPERWHSWPWQQQNSFCIVETGFGTRLNFLLTWQAWREQQSLLDNKVGWLHFTSIEKFPLSQEQLQQALALWPQLNDLPALLLKSYPLLISGEHYLVWPEERISLTLYWDDIKDALPQLSGPVHAWYLDGFAPARNPEMWCDELYLQMRRLSQRHESQYHNILPATVATFTAAGAVRRGLQGAGFEVAKHRGHGPKRDMLAGRFTRAIGPERPAYFWNKPWLVSPVTPAKEVIVIGAGLAGCTTARALAERGVKVTIIDPHGIAKQGSGNAQGGLYIKLAANDSAIHTRFHLTAYQFAIRFLQHHLGAATVENSHWQQCGLLQLAVDDTEAKRQQQLLLKTPLPKELAQPVTAAQASVLAGAALEQGGMFFPQGGWVSPVDLCERLLQHPNIHFKQLEATHIQQTSTGWQMDSQDGVLSATDIVLATAYHTKSLLPQAHLPIKFIRGQLSYVKSDCINGLNTVISGNSFITPEKDGVHSIGATFTTDDANPRIEEQDHRFNLNNLRSISAQWQPAITKQGLTAIQGGRVGFRCTTQDHLPIVGQIPDNQAFLQRFAHMAKNAKSIAKTPAPIIKGLWLNLGHGAKGLVSTPICAELLANQITQNTSPVGVSITEALWPGRFLVRDFIRGKFTKKIRQ